MKTTSDAGYKSMVFVALIYLVSIIELLSWVWLQENTKLTLIWYFVGTGIINAIIFCPLCFWLLPKAKEESK